MTIEQYQLEVGGIPVEVVRKDIKNLHVGVYPPAGRVRVAAPLQLDAEAVRLAVVTRLSWIRRQMDKFAGQARQSAREMVTGERHYYQGRRYRLDVVVGDRRPGVRLRNNSTIELRVRPGSSREERESVLARWYRRQLRDQLPPLLNKWSSKVGVRVAEVRIRKMKTCWGTCNQAEGRIWLNLELIKKVPSCLEYVLVHEMVHLLEKHHNDEFHAIMDRVMPQWPMLRDELNRAPLAHDDWEY